MTTSRVDNNKFAQQFLEQLMEDTRANAPDDDGSGKGKTKQQGKSGKGHVHIDLHGVKLPTSAKAKEDPMGALLDTVGKLEQSGELNSVLAADPALASLLAQALLQQSNSDDGVAKAKDNQVLQKAAKAVGINPTSAPSPSGTSASGSPPDPGIGGGGGGGGTAPTQAHSPTVASKDGAPPTEAATAERTKVVNQIVAYGKAHGLNAHQQHLMLAMAMQETDSLSVPAGQTCGDYTHPKSGGAENIGFMNFNVGTLLGNGKTGISQSDIDKMKADPNNVALAGDAFVKMLKTYGEDGLVAKQRMGYDASPSDPAVQGFATAINNTTAWMDAHPQDAINGQRYAYNVGNI